jgi:hypothetical protein
MGFYLQLSWKKTDPFLLNSFTFRFIEHIREWIGLLRDVGWSLQKSPFFDGLHGWKGINNNGNEELSILLNKKDALVDLKVIK